MAIAESLDHPHMGDILDVEARDLDEAAQLTLIARKDPLIEMKQLNALMKWIRKTLGTPVTVVVKLLPNGSTRKE